MSAEPSSMPETTEKQLSTSEISDVKQQAYNLLTDAHAVQHGHFKLSSGLHSNTYVQCAKVMEDPRKCGTAFELLKNLIDASFPEPLKPTVVLGAATGGIIASYALAAQYGCRAIFAERELGQLVLRRGFGLGFNDRVIIVEDVITTGKTTKELIQLVQSINTPIHILCIASLVERAKNNFGAIPQVGLMTPKDAVVVNPEDCVQCKEGIQLTAPGSRFLSNH